MVHGRAWHKIAALRATSWVFIVAAVAVALGLFLPALQVRPGGAVISKRAELSLYEISRDRHTLRRLLAIYHGSARRDVGGKLIRAVTPKLTGKSRAALEDARDAMDTLDDLSDDDIRKAGTALTATVWGLVGLQVLLVLLVFGEVMTGAFRRWRLALVALGALLSTAVAIGLHLACREAAWQANDEVGRTIATLGPGAYLSAAAAIASLLCAVVLIAKRRGGATAPARAVRSGPRR